MRCSLLFILALCAAVVFWGIVVWSKSVHPLIDSLRTMPQTGVYGRRGEGKSNYYYILVIDAGSSGTRMNAFKFVGATVDSSIKHSDIELIPPSAAKDKIPKRRTETRRAYQRVETEPGLSEYVSDLESIESRVLEPLLEWARAVVPEPHWHKTPIFLFGTAGMRRLSDQKQNTVLDICRHVLINSVFKFDSSWARVIRGVDEGIYGWAALNAMEDRLGSNDTLGALDLGGSSLEITYAVSDDVKGEHTVPVLLGNNQYHVYTYSHRHAGLDDAFQRSLQILEKNRTLDREIRHPCVHEGYREHVKRVPLDGKSPASLIVEVVGAPDEGLCDTLAEHVVKQTAPCTENERDNCVISSQHPKFGGNFAAMSGFYVVNHFYNLNSRSTVEDLSKITDSFCSLSWKQVQKKHKNELAVETYCFRGEYIEALLGVGLELDDSKLLLGYKSPGWPLGAALIHGFSGNDTITHHSYFATSRPIFIVFGCVCAILLAYFVYKARLFRAYGNRRRYWGKGGSSRGLLSSRGSFATLSMEHGETYTGWHQTSTSGGAMSRSRTFSRKLSGLSSSEL